MNTKNRGLGRGLSALISNREDEHAPSGGTLYVNVREITPSPYQPRKNFDQEKLEELAASIKANGLIQPLVVRSTDNGYELITGERRWRASKNAGLERVPAIVRDMDNNTAMALAMIENLQREDLNPMEKAIGLKRLRSEAKLGQEEIARELGISRAQVANILRLLKLPEDIQDMLSENKISSGHARTLLALQAPEEMLQAAKKIIKNGLNVRQTEKMIQDWGKKKNTPSQPATDTNLKETVKSKFSSALGNDVRIRFRGDSNSGKITLEYKNQQDLNRILHSLENEN